MSRLLGSLDSLYHCHTSSLALDRSVLSVAVYHVCWCFGVAVLSGAWCQASLEPQYVPVGEAEWQFSHRCLVTEFVCMLGVLQGNSLLLSLSMLFFENCLGFKNLD